MPSAVDEAYFEKDSDTLAKEALDEAKSGWWVESEKTREQRIAWWREARFGCFVHWGVYSVLAGNWRGKHHEGYAEHIQRALTITQDEYRRDAVEQFNPEHFDAEKWVSLVARSGAKMFAITAKHHDGFAMYDSAVSDYNIVRATPFGRDPMSELRDACRRHGLKFGFYYSHAFDWGEPHGPGNDWEYENPGGDLHLHGGTNWWDENPALRRPIVREYVDKKSIPQILELIENYDPDFLWFDTSGKLPFHENMRILKAIREVSQTVVVNGRLARGRGGNYGDYVNTGDRAAEFARKGGDWETMPTTNESYGYHAEDHSHKPPAFFIRVLAKVASRSGNVLINLGPMGDGRIDPKDVRIFEAIGDWLAVNGEAIYGTTGSPLPLQHWGVTTMKGEHVFLHVFDWPADGRLIVGGLKTDPAGAAMLIDDHDVAWRRLSELDVELRLPDGWSHDADSVVRLTFGSGPEADAVYRMPTDVASRLLAFDAERCARVDADAGDGTKTEVTGGKTGLSYGDGKIAEPRYFVHGWSSTDQWLRWSVRLTEPGRFSVTLWYTPAHQSGGGDICLRAGQSVLEAGVPTDGDPKSARQIELGEVALDPGLATIELMATRIGDNQIMRPLELAFSPID